MLEIYPRYFTGPVVKSDALAREAYLRRAAFADLPREVLAIAAASEDAFDALVSVLGMVRGADGLAALSIARDDDEFLEGAIWHP